VYVSWNGATHVNHWRVLAGASSDERQAVATAAKHGFGGQVTITRQPYLDVQALDRAGATPATSSVVRAL
jgi:hypothetical protein